jgi:hypothetical protein
LRSDRLTPPDLLMYLARALTVVVVLALVVAGRAGEAVAQDAPARGGEPSELWREFPLEQGERTPATPSRRTERPTRRPAGGGQPVPEARSQPDSAPATRGLVLTLAAVAAALGVAIALPAVPAARRRMRRRRWLDALAPLATSPRDPGARLALPAPALSQRLPTTTPLPAPPSQRFAREPGLGLAPETDPDDVLEVAWRRTGSATMFYLRPLDEDVARAAPEALRPSPQARRAHEQLLERLRREGWEPTGHGHEWYAARFRHPSSTASAAPAEGDGPPVILWR